jgi:EAL domain-containing protein (putative c-di-GMP-specific phosphodiesterase class I)
MHRAKIHRHSGFEYYESTMTHDVQERVELEASLRSALEHGQIELHYQPLISVRDSRVAGVEALMRWRDPKRGWIPPTVFIPIAEHSNLIFGLGEWALAEACRQARAWDGGARKVRISVNISARQFRSEGFVDSVERELSASGVDPSQLVLEMTESVLADDLSAVARTFARLQALGVQVAIDDFGTGYSSLSYLSQLPIDCLKIDQSFVQRYAADEYGTEVIRAIINLGATLGMKVVAEGVEAVDQFEFLHQHGCDEVQGFLFSKALPSDAALDYITRN